MYEVKINIKEIKIEAKEKIKGNKFSLYWPIFLMNMIELFSIIIFIIPYLYAVNDKTESYTNVKAASIFGIIIVILIYLITRISYKSLFLISLEIIVLIMKK